MTLNFPAAPENFEVYDNYIWIAAENAWRRTTTPPNTQLGALEDVTISSIADGDALVYDSASGEWVNETLSSTISDLTDVDIVEPADRQFLVYDSTSGNWFNDTLVTNFNDVFEVDISTPQTGDSLVYDGSNWINSPKPGKNLLYNGAMQVHQRGTSATGIATGGYFTADRWNTVADNMGTWTQTSEDDAPVGSGLRKSTKLLCTTADSTPAASDLVYFRQMLEGQDVQQIKKGTSAAEQLTLSFWVKSNVTGTYVLNLQDADNTRQVSAQYIISASGAWEKKTISFPADDIGAFDNDNSVSLRILWFLGAGTNFTSGTLRTTWTSTVIADLAVGQTNLAAADNNYWQITGVQLEVGPVATPFEFKPFGQELAECQRYYYKIVSGVTGEDMAVGWNASAIVTRNYVYPPTTLRTRPTALETTGVASDYSVRHGVIATTCSVVPVWYTATTDVLSLQLQVASGLTTGQGCSLRANSTSAFLAWSAEL
jgi:hypothetical protein